ncbi:MAG: EcsC family protein [Niastella sp.]|nr:EcsC family protein [Niastella sp.]
MNSYEQNIQIDLKKWQQQMLRKPTLFSRVTRRVQTKINNIIPEKVHQAITATIKQMIRAVIFGAKITAPATIKEGTLADRETTIEEKITIYRNTAAAEGGITGAGGLLLGLADFPILIGIKLKLLFDIASQYGYNVEDYKERIYILYIFQLAFSSQQQRREVYLKMEHWGTQKHKLPEDIHAFDWRTFQQEYRDYIDLAKMAQLIPIIGAPVGAVVNYRLIRKLGHTAMMAYRMRYFEEKSIKY